MIHTIRPNEHEKSADLLEAMYRLRHDVVVEQWNWTIPGATMGREKDAFDTDKTVYFIVTGEAGTPHEHTALACARLNPTTREHMMDQLFADYCDLQDYQRNESVWEVSRYLSDNTLFEERAASKLARSKVNLAMVEFALTHKISHFIWLTHQIMYGAMLTVWESEPLGRPKRAPGADSAWIAGISKIDHAAQMRVENLMSSLRAHLARKPDILSMRGTG